MDEKLSWGVATKPGGPLALEAKGRQHEYFKGTKFYVLNNF